MIFKHVGRYMFFCSLDLLYALGN